MRRLGEFIDTKLSADRDDWTIIQIIKPANVSLSVETGIHPNVMQTPDAQANDATDSGGDGDADDRATQSDESDEDEANRPRKRAKPASKPNEDEEEFQARWAEYVTTVGHAQGRTQKNVALYVKSSCVQMVEGIFGKGGMQTLMSPSESSEKKAALLNDCKARKLVDSFAGTATDKRLVKACLNALLADIE